MHQWRGFPLPDGSYSDDTRPWTQQDVCNYLPTFAEASGTRSRLLYRTAPGLQTFANIGSGPHRAARDVEGRLFVVSGTTLYQVAADGTATSRGTIPGTGFVSMTHNQVDGGNQLVIGTRDNSYVYDTTTGTLTATAVGLLSVDFLNQRILGVDTQRRFWRYSGLADATSWNTLDNESAESSPDRIVGGIVSQGEWLVFGERTLEVWVNTPTDDTAFQRSVVVERGCLNANTIRRLDNSVFFVDNNGIPCRLNGYQPVPIAPKAIIAEIAACDPTKLFAFTWEDHGYVVYYLTAQDGRTWGYDVTSQKWHRRESFGLDRWRMNTLLKWNGAWYGGDYANGKLYKLLWQYVYEGCELMPRSMRSGVVHGDGNRVFVHGFRLNLQSGGVDSTIDVGAAPSISGSLPDFDSGAVVHYQYTVTPGYPGQSVTLTLDGALPNGLSMDSTGLVTGTVRGSGAYAWSITPSSECASGDALTDSNTIKALAAHFDGTGDKLTASKATPIIATGDFTIEARVSVAGAGAYGIVSGRNSNIRGWALQIGASGVIQFRMSMNTGLIDTTNNLLGGSVAAHVMTHIAITRQGNLFTLWKDGVSVDTYTNAGTIDEPGVALLAIGTSYSAVAENMLNGYVDWLAITLGTCRYTSTFTPPVDAAAVTGASVALDFNEPIGSTTFADTGSLGLAWTRAGDVVIAEYPY